MSFRTLPRHSLNLCVSCVSAARHPPDRDRGRSEHRAPRVGGHRHRPRLRQRVRREQLRRAVRDPRQSAGKGVQQ